MFLTREEITEMTGKQQSRAQARALDAMRIVYKVRPDGTLLVLRSHVIEQLGGGHGADASGQVRGAGLGEHLVERPMRKSERLRLQQALLSGATRKA